MTSSDAIAEHHQEALGDGWRVAQQFHRLHFRAVREFAGAVEHDGPRERAVVSLGNHSFNIYTAALDLVIRGQFDVAAYLMRPLFDMPGLVLATANDEENANRVLPGGDGLRASDARKWVEAHPEVAKALSNEGGLYRYMNDYAHSQPYHVESILEITDDGIIPTVGGRIDDLRARRDTAIICGLDRDILIAMGEQLHGGSGRDWRADFVLAVESYNEWFKSVRDAVTQRNARVERRASELSGESRT